MVFLYSLFNTKTQKMHFFGLLLIFKKGNLFSKLFLFIYFEKKFSKIFLSFLILLPLMEYECPKILYRPSLKAF